MTRSSRSIRVLIVADHAAVRNGLRHLLAIHTDLEVIAETADAAHALESGARFSTDVVVLDAQLNGGSGFAVARQLRSVDPQACLIVLINGDEPAADLLRTDVYTCLPKRLADEQLAPVIREVSRGARGAGETW